MAILDIKTFPDPVLQKKSKPVKVFDDELRTLSENMLETMRVANGIGLAAPQVGVLKQLLVIEIPKEDEEGEEHEDHKEKTENLIIVICNPKIVSFEGSYQIEEGCLSLPGFYLEVDRSQKIRVEGQTISGEDLVLEADGLLSICVQHEIDHLHGKLLVNYVSPIKRKLYQQEMKKHGENLKLEDGRGPRSL